MGVDGLNDLIKDKGGGFDKCVLSEFRGKRIGIDAPWWCASTYAIAHKTIYKKIKKADLAIADPKEEVIMNEWFKTHVAKTLIMWLKNDVTPLFIFDGDARPEKEAERTRRRTTKQAKTDELEADRANIDSRDILERGEIDIENYRKKKMMHPHYNYRAMKCLKKVLDAIGLPWAIAKHDAEQLCAILSIEGFTFATFTKDTDALAFGARFILTSRDYKLNFDEGVPSPSFSCLDSQKVFKELGLSFPEFVDMCILAGCDYNSGLGQISLKRAYEIIREYGSIDDIPQSRPGYLSNDELRKLPGFGNLPYSATFKLKELNHVKCRNIFQFVTSVNFIKECDLDLRATNIDELNKICEKYEISASFNLVIKEKDKLSAPASGIHTAFFIL